MKDYTKRVTVMSVLEKLVLDKWESVKFYSATGGERAKIGCQAYFDVAKAEYNISLNLLSAEQEKRRMEKRLQEKAEEELCEL